MIKVIYIVCIVRIASIYKSIELNTELNEKTIPTNEFSDELWHRYGKAYTYCDGPINLNMFILWKSICLIIDLPKKRFNMCQCSIYTPYITQVSYRCQSYQRSEVLLVFGYKW